MGKWVVTVLALIGFWDLSKSNINEAMKRGWNENVGFYVNIAVFKATNLSKSSKISNISSSLKMNDRCIKKTNV